MTLDAWSKISSPALSYPILRTVATSPVAQHTFSERNNDMAITADDIKYFYTGGPDNNNGDNSLGGVISDSEVSTSINGLFDNINGYESLVGSVEYRCIAIKNVNESDVLTNTKLFVSTKTEGDDYIWIAVEVPTEDAVQSIATDDTAPIDLTFSIPDSTQWITCTSSGSEVGSIEPGKWIAIWIKRVVPAGAKTFHDNNFTIQLDGQGLM
jgi:hypothetical protein